MAKYRKKPVIVDAMLCADIIDAMDHSWLALPKWVKDAYDEGVIRVVTHDYFLVRTLEGSHTASRSDMLIKGVQGELYPCKPDIFKETYDLVEEK